MAGGVVHGATDELGFHAVENRHYVTDLHATGCIRWGWIRQRIELDYGQKIAEIIA